MWGVLRIIFSKLSNAITALLLGKPKAAGARRAATREQGKGAGNMGRGVPLIAKLSWFIMQTINLDKLHMHGGTGSGPDPRATTPP